jgi:AcrR family transcriptional regulator
MALSGRKAEIVSAAAVLMRANGYAGTSMRDIASVLNMEAASLYNHFASKEDILKEICFSMGEAFNKSLQEVNDIYFNAAERLGMAVRAHTRLLTENPDAGHVFLHEWRHLSEPSLGNFKKLRDEYEAAFRSIVRNGEDEGVFQEVDHKFATLTILSSLNWVVEWYRPDGDMSPDEIAARLTRFILSGLSKHP